MIYSNSETSRLPDLMQTMSLLAAITRRFPVLHRSPESLIANDPEVNILTHNGYSYSLRPNISCQGAIFGWYNDYEELINPIEPHSYNNNVNSFLHKQSHLRIFEKILNSHPFYTLLKKGVFLPDVPFPISIYDPYGLALSYGLETPLIPLTSSLEVAAFHASTQYDRFTNTFRPLDEGKTGVIFVFELYDRFSMINNLKVIGKQPFRRPGLNKLFALDIGDIRKLEEFPNVKGFRFRHTKQGFLRIYDKFNQGRNLYPDEVLNRKVNQLLELDDIGKEIQANKRIKIHRNSNGLQSLLNNMIFRRNLAFSQEELENEWFSNAAILWSEFWKKTLFPNFNKKQIEYLLGIPDNSDYKKYFNQKDWISYLKDEFSK